MYTFLEEQFQGTCKYRQALQQKMKRCHEMAR